jgi:hypothetical protein
MGGQFLMSLDTGGTGLRHLTYRTIVSSPRPRAKMHQTGQTGSE